MKTTNNLNIILQLFALFKMKVTVYELYVILDFMLGMTHTCTVLYIK